MHANEHVLHTYSDFPFASFEVNRLRRRFSGLNRIRSITVGGIFLTTARFVCRCGRARGASTGYDTRYIHRIRHTVYIPMCLDDRRTSTMKATWSAHVSKKSQKDLGTSHLRCSAIAHTSTSPPRVLVGRRYIVLGRRDGVCCRHGCRGHEAAAPARARAAEPARWSTTHPAFIQHLFGVSINR